MYKPERIQQFFKNKRMSQGTDYIENYLFGLYPMIIKYVKGDFHIIEIGSYEGATTELFMNYCSLLYSIDPYAEGEDCGQETPEDLAAAEQVMMNRMRDYGNAFHHYKLPSLRAARLIQNGSADLVYIDGDHRHDSVVADIKAWLPKVKSGGYIAGHDYYDWIKQAVIETIGTPDETFIDGSWIKRIK